MDFYKCLTKTLLKYFFLTDEGRATDSQRQLLFISALKLVSSVSLAHGQPQRQALYCSGWSCVSE